MSESIKVSYQNGEVTIAASREGLQTIAKICANLAELTDAQAETPAGHYHIADYMSNAEAGSVPMVIARKTD